MWTVYISYQNLREDARTVLVDPAMLSAHKKALEEIARLSGARLDVTALELSQLADVVSVQEAEEDREAVTALLRVAMEPALRELLAMREREGAAMAADLARRGKPSRGAEAIERRARKRWRNTTRNCASAYPRCWKRPWTKSAWPPKWL